jgi:trimeric autotransporter adhesin
MNRNALCRTLWAGAVLALSVFCPTLMHGQEVSSAARLITTAVNNGDRVALSGSLRRNLKQATDLGPANTSLMARHVIMVLTRSADRQTALDQYLSAVQNTQSSQYHQWVAPAQYGARFGASADDVQAVTAWLQSQGLTIEKASAAANMISFSGTIGQIETAFSTTIHSISIDGEKHLSNITAPQVPRALAPAVKGLLGLDDFRPRPGVQNGPSAKFNTSTGRIQPDLTAISQGSTYLYVVPADVATIYDTPNTTLNKTYKGTNYDGAGVTVGVVGDSNFLIDPVTNYRLAFLGETSSNVNLPNTIIDGDDPGINEDEVETFLDLEVLGGVAPKAKINYYLSADSDLSGGLFNAMERAVNDNQVSILSISYGLCEANAGTDTNAFFNEIYEQAAAQGITVTVSSGDSGAAGCDSDGSQSAVGGLAVSGLGSTPYNISVGGTDFPALLANFYGYVSSDPSGGTAPYYGTALSYIPERPWNDSTDVNNALANNVATGGSGGSTNIIAGGGGKSNIYTKPPFQSSLTPADGARDVPDVSFLAGNGFYAALWTVCEWNDMTGSDCATTNGVLNDTAVISGAGGTSAATPAFAGMLALVVQSTGSRLGQANNVLYKLAANKYSTVFHDVTDGNNAVVCSAGSTDCGANGFTTGYDATTGYDLASGLGSVDAAAMIASWNTAVGASSSTTLQIDGSTSPISVTHGTSLNFAVNVNPTTATGVAGLITTATAAVGSPTLNGTPYTIAINNGTGSGTFNGLPGGQYTVYANYAGDLNDAASQSKAISVNIAPEASSTMLWVNAYTYAEVPLSSLNAIPYGSYVFGETSVYGTAEGYTNSLGYATGKVTYLDNGTLIGTAPITSGNLASFPQLTDNSYPFTVGAHKLTATYPGDASYKANASNEVDFTIVKDQSTAVLTPTVPTVTSTTTDNLEVDIHTTSLAAFPTGTITITANGVTLATLTNLTGANTVGSYTAFAYVVVPINGAKLVNGPNTITASYSGDNNYLPSTGTTVITATITSFSLRTSAINIGAGSTSGSATLSVAPSGSFAGLVDLTCAVTSAPANALSPITCTVPSSILLTGTATVSGTLAVNSSQSTTAGTYIVTITGTDAATGKLTATTTSTVTVAGAPGITLSNSAPITVAAGATTGNTSTLTVTPTSGFTGQVSISCAVTSMPADAVNPVTCGVSPASVAISGTSSSTSVLTIGSTAKGTAALYAPQEWMRGVGGTVFALGLFFCVPTRRRRQLRIVAALLAMVALGALVGCGGASAGAGGGGKTVPPGTTTGTYVVTVTAIPVGAAAQTTTVNVTVQ